MTAIEIRVERDNVNDESVVIRKVHRRNGELVQLNDVILELETSKTAMQIRAPAGGVLAMSVRENDEIAVGELLFNISPENATSDPPVPTNGAPSAAATVTADPDEPKPSRAARRLASELGVELRDVVSSGWITSADVLGAARNSSTSAPSEGAARLDPVSPRAAAPRPQAVPQVPFRSQRKTLSKRTESRNLVRANGSGSTSMIGIELPQCGSRLIRPPFLFQDSVSDLIIFEAARLLRLYPELNAFHLDERTTGYFEAVNFGISFDAGSKLKVLALENADTLSLSQVQGGFERLLALYESAAPIPPELLRSATVTLSDLSRSGADFMLPLLNSEQTLTIGITRRAPDGYQLYASFDHRVSEGLQVARFLEELRQRVQSHHRPAGEEPQRASALRCSICDQSMASELKLGGRGFLKILAADGSEGLLCRNCFQGWS